tara:strand:- start:11579 stop:12088 length:510 start_codon:yes stop_codon:yes gene_type:complete
MANQSCLILIKPDGLIKSITGNIINELSIAKLKIIGAKVVSVQKELAEQHYAELKAKNPKIFKEVLKYICGEYHTPRVLALIYSGEDAIAKIREIVGVTNPEEANPTTIRGRYGRINSKTNVLENCIHASDSPENAEKEIKLWFNPDEIVEKIYPTKTEKKDCEITSWA